MNTLDYLVEMTVVPASTVMTPQEGVTFIERYVLPTLSMCKQLRSDGKLVGGGPIAGSMALALIMRVSSVEELDGLIEQLPLWPRTQVTIKPLTTFEGREKSVALRLQGTKARLQAAMAK